MPGVQAALYHVLTIQNQHVVLSVHAKAAQAANDPSVRKGLRPGPIDLVLGHAGLRLQ